MVDKPKSDDSDEEPRDADEAAPDQEPDDSAEPTAEAGAGPDDGNDAETADEANGEAAAEADDVVEQSFFDGAGEDEIDPELMKIPKRRRRRRRHPVISLVVIALSLYLLYFLKDDLLFYLQPRVPVEVGNAAEALKAGKLQPNTHIKLIGTPDRKHALVIESRVTGYDSFFRLLETSNRLFVQRHRERRNTDREITTVHTGQLTLFESLPYEESLRKYFAKKMNIAHDLRFEEVRRAMNRPGKVKVKDIAGQAVTLDQDTEIWINAAFSGEWIVQFSKKFHPRREKVTEQMKALNLPFAADDEASKLFWRYVVLAQPDQVQVLMARFRDRALHAGVIRRQVSYSARWNQLSVVGDQLVIEAADPTFPTRYRLAAGATSEGGSLEPVKSKVVKIPARALLYISTSSPFEVPAGAMVLLTGKAPGDNWYYLLLCIVLFGFVALNVYTLFQRFRHRAPASGAARKS